MIRRHERNAVNLRGDFLKGVTILRVLHVHSGNLYGGVETTLMAQARNSNLCEEMSLSFALCFEGRLSKELRSANSPVMLLGECRVRNPLSIARARKRLRGLLQDDAPDVVVFHSAWTHCIFGPVVREAKIPLVVWFHGLARGKHWLDWWASKTLPPLAICNSEFTASSVRDVYPQVEAQVVYNPLITSPTESHRAATREALGISDKAVTIIQVSRMEEWKGHALHLSALAKLRDLPDWVCLQVGGAQQKREARYLAELKKQAARLGISDRVIFLGERSDVPELLAASDIHCQPNIGPEPFGNTFIEALCAGLPVVTVRIGGAVEIINDSCGILVPPNDPAALASALRSLIQNSALRKRLGASGFARAQEMAGVQKQMDRLAEVFQKVVKQKPVEVSY